MIAELLLAATVLHSNANTLQSTDSPTLDPSPAQRCRESLSNRFFPEAVNFCRKAVAEKPADLDLLKIAAAVEFNAGNSAESADLWERVLDREWTIEASRELAKAWWRGGQTEDAERLLRNNLRRAPSGQTAGDMIRFLSAFGRNDEAATLAREQAPKYPKSCEIEEMRGVAEAAEGRHRTAAAAYARAIRNGCPPFRWTGLGAGAETLDHPAYRPLLNAEAIVEGLEQLDDANCLKRLILLRHTMDAEAVEPILNVIRTRETPKIRLAALGLLAQLGDSAKDAWRILLDEDDFLLRKHVLRRIVGTDNPAFIALLESHFEEETMRGNRSLVALGLANLYLKTEKTGPAIASLELIPEDDPLFIKAQILLADLAADGGDGARELFHLEQALRADPKSFRDEIRLNRLRREIGPLETTVDGIEGVLKAKEVQKND